MFSLSLSQPRKYKEKKILYRKSSLPHSRWLRLLILLMALVFIFAYIPLLHFIRNTPDLTPQNHNIVRNQIILYRIIGNDLPPRHKEGQTLSNLQFILDHEPSFPDTKKIFLLNRIIDPVSEHAIIRLLTEYNMEYIRIPFIEHEYQQLDFKLEEFPYPDFLHSDDYRRYSKVSKLRVLDYTYHSKNLYAMNNNGGRNTAIQHGRSIPNAKWIMPFDGNCYLSLNGFKEIRNQLERHGKDTKYFTVPMTRLLNNSVLLNNLDERPKAPEEPQIIFRYDATEEYNLNMRYGRRSKLELLWRLGALENRRLNRPTVPWEPVERPYSKDKGNYKNIGWVFRLFSGNQQQEENKKEASSIRAFNRLLAIQSSLDSLDENIARRTFHHERLFLFNEKTMTQSRYSYWTKKDYIQDTFQQLEEDAEAVWKATQQKLALMNEPPYDVAPEKEELAPLSKNVTLLTMAHHFLGNEKYGKAAANLIRVHFLNEYAVEDEDEYTSARRIPDDSHLLDFLSDQGYSFPSQSRVSRVVSKYNRHRILNTSDLTKTDITALLDSMRMLSRMQALTHKEYIDLQGIIAEFLEYLVTSPTGIHLAQMTDHRGALYDLQVIAMAAFTDDVRLFLRVANRCRMRIGKQFTSDGQQLHEETWVRTRLLSGVSQKDSFEEWRAVLHYETLNLQYWTLLARGIQNSGIAKDIWYYTAKNQGCISHAVVTHLKKYADRLPLLSKEDSDFVKSRLQPLAHMALGAFSADDSDYKWLLEHKNDFGTGWDYLEQDTSSYMKEDAIKGRLGIPPFWMLTLGSGDVNKIN